MTSISALPPALPRSRQSPAAAAEGGDAFAAMLAGVAAVTAAPTTSSTAPRGSAVGGTTADGGSATGAAAAGPVGVGPGQAGAGQVGAGQAGASQAGAVLADAPFPGAIAPGATQPGTTEAGTAPALPSPSTGPGGPVPLPAGRSRDLHSATPQPSTPGTEIGSTTGVPITATTTVPVVATGAASLADGAAEGPAPAPDTAVTPTTTDTGDLTGDQAAGDQPAPELPAPLLDTVRTDPPVVDVRPVAPDQVVGAVADLRRTDVVAPLAAPAPATPPAPPAAQVFQLLTPLLEGPDGAHAMSLQLHPEELGAVQVDVALLRGEITLALHARDAAAQDALRAALPMLKAELEASGLTATSLSVDGGRADQQPGERPARQGGSLTGGSGDGTPTGSPVPTTSDPDAALDVRM